MSFKNDIEKTKKIISHINPIVVEKYSYTYPLSKYFDIGEFIISQTATRMNIDNEPTDLQVENMKNLCVNVLDPIREHFGAVFISSGFRCEELNKSIGGSSNSQHRYGEAADFSVSRITITDLYEWIVLKSNIEYDQIIHEFGRWIHISFTKRYGNRKLNTVAMNVNGKTEYSHYTKKAIEIGEYKHS